MSTATIKYFAFAHLPAHLQLVSKPIGELAKLLEQQLPASPEKTVGMRKLLEAKDCFVRAALDAPKPAATSLLPPHQQRVIDERRELDEKADKLAIFISTRDEEGSVFGNLPGDEQMRLCRQLEAMRGYSSILAERIAAFAPAITGTAA
ncbi:crAss001_48 related protein [Telluria sp. B2]